MNRNKKYRIEFAESGQRCQYDVDALTIAIIPTDEEVMIARDCYKAIKGTL